MYNKPLVTVIIPCYNVSSYVAKALNSIIEQTYSKLEIILVDDASTDDTLSVVKSFNDNRLKIIELQENTQKIGAVNYALSLANGDFIAFQDADDWAEPNRIELQVAAFLNNSKLGICFTGYKYFGEHEYTVSNIAYNNEELIKEFLKFGTNINPNLQPTCCPSMMIKASIIKVTGGYHPYFAGKVAEDIHWISRILKYSEGYTIKQTLYNYQVRTGSLTQNQLAGLNPKAAYTWHLLAKIIKIDQEEGVDILHPDHASLLKDIELEACEEALVGQIKLNNKLRQTFEQSATFKLGKFLLMPYHFFNTRRNKK